MIKSFDDIQDKLLRLQENYQQQPDNQNIQGKTLNAYANNLFAQLTQIAEGSQDINDLNDFLIANWTLVNGTSLSYTALPDHELTVLLCDVAQFVVQEKNKQITADEKPFDIVTTLMPTVCIDSIHDDYPMLGAEFDYSANEVNKKNKWITHDIDIINILKTHILGREGKYLIPVQLITEIDLSAPNQSFVNPYYDGNTQPAEMAYLDAGEIERLLTHSEATRTIINTQKQYEIYVNDKSNLLGHLREFSRQLYFNSVAGVGHETNAGAGTYAAIINFNDYYQKLADTEKDKIPEPVRTEIELLLKLATDVKSNINATENLETCIATRRTKLEYGIEEHELILSTIGLVGERKDELIAMTSQQFAVSVTSLKQSLTEHKYAEGKDSLHLTLPLLRTLGVDLLVSSQEDLQNILALNPEEILAVCQDKDIAPQIIAQIPDLEALIIILISNPPAKLKALLSATSPELANKVLESGREVAAILRIMDADRKLIIVESMKYAIKTSGELEQVLAEIPEAQHNDFFTSIKDVLPQCFHSAEDYIDFVESLSVEQQGIVFSAMQGHFHHIVRSNSELESISNQLSSEQSAIISAEVISRINDIIRSSENYYSLAEAMTLLAHLPTDQHPAAIDVMKEHLPKIILKIRDLNDLLKSLSPELGDLAFAEMLKHLPQVMHDGYDYERLVQDRTSEERALIFKEMESHLPGIINSGENFASLFLYLDADQRKAAFSILKDSLSNFIKTTEDYVAVIRYANVEQLKVIYQAFRNQMPDLIKSASELGQMLAIHTVEQQTEIYRSMKDGLPKLILSIKDFQAVFARLTFEDRTDIYEMIKESLPDFVTKLDDVHTVLSIISRENGDDFCKRLNDKGKWPDIIKSSAMIETLDQITNSQQQFQIAFASVEKAWPKDLNQLKTLFKKLNEQNLLFVCKKMKEHLLPLITSVADLKVVLDPLFTARKDFVYQELKDHIVGLIHTEEEFADVVQRINPQNCAELCMLLKERLPSIINSTEQLRHLFNSVSSYGSKKSDVIYKAMGEVFPKFVRTLDDLVFILKALSPTEGADLCNKIKGLVPEMVNSEAKMRELLELTSYNPDTFNIIYKAIEDRIPELISSTGELQQILKKISERQGALLCSKVAARLPNIIHTTDDFVEILNIPALAQGAFMSMLDHLPKIIQSGHDYANLTNILKPGQNDAIFQVMLVHLPYIINSGQSFSLLFKNLDTSQRETAFSMLKEHLDKFIKSGEDYRTVLKYLSIDQAKYVAEVTRNVLPDLIKTGKDFVEALAPLTPEQRLELYEATKHRLPDLIDSSRTFKQILSYLSADKHAEIYESVKERLPSCVTIMDDIEKTLEYLSPEQGDDFCERLKTNGTWQSIVRNTDAIDNLYEAVNEKQFQIAFSSIETSWPKHYTQLAHLFGYLPLDSCHYVCEQMKSHLPALINSAEQLQRVLNPLSGHPDKCDVIYHAMKEHIPELITSAEELGALLKKLSPADCADLCVRMKERLPQLIHSQAELKKMLVELPHAQNEAVLEAIKEIHLNQVFKTNPNSNMSSGHGLDNTSAILKHNESSMLSIRFINHLWRCDENNHDAAHDLRTKFYHLIQSAPIELATHVLDDFSKSDQHALEKMNVLFGLNLDREELKQPRLVKGRLEKYVTELCRNGGIDARNDDMTDEKMQEPS